MEFCQSEKVGTLLYTSVCNNTVVMWPLFIEVIVSFYVKITQGKFL